MIGLIACISAFFFAFRRHPDLALENLALRQQPAIFKRRHPRPSLRPTDRLFWVWLSKIWTGWREALIIVKPETVIAWKISPGREFFQSLRGLPLFFQRSKLYKVESEHHLLNVIVRSNVTKLVALIKKFG
jgi:hypothetical protein